MSVCLTALVQFQGWFCSEYTFEIKVLEFKNMSYITSRSCEAKEVITKLADFLIEYELGYAEKMFLKLCMVLF